MIILHAGFGSGRLLLWAEQQADPSAATARRGAKTAKTPPAAHSPYDADADALRKALGAAGLSAIAEAPPFEAAVWLPTRNNRPLASSPLIAEEPETGAAPQIALWRVTAFPLTTEHALTLLAACWNRETLAPGMLAGLSLTFWAAAMRFAGALTARQQFLPGLEEREGRYRACWQPFYGGADADRLRKLAQAMPHACRALTELQTLAPPETPALSLLSAFLAEICDALVRAAPAPETALPASRRPIKAKTAAKTPAFDSLHDQWLHALHSADGRMSGRGGGTERPSPRRCANGNVRFRCPFPRRSASAFDWRNRRRTRRRRQGRTRNGTFAIYCRPATIPVCSFPWRRRGTPERRKQNSCSGAGFNASRIPACVPGIRRQSQPGNRGQPEIRRAGRVFPAHRRRASIPDGNGVDAGTGGLSAFCCPRGGRAKAQNCGFPPAPMSRPRKCRPTRAFR